MTELVVPELGESITEATVGRWLKQVGEPVQADEPLVDLETDKVTVQLPAPAAGTLAEVKAGEGATVTVGQVIAVFQAGAADVPAVKKPPKSVTAAAAAPVPVPVPVAPERGTDGKRLSPAERKEARERGAAIPVPVPARASVTASVTVPPTATAPVAAPVSAPVSAPATVSPTATASATDEVVPMSPLRKRIAQRLVEAQHTAAILTTFNEVDMSAVMALRAAHKEEFAERYGVKLGLMSFFVKASVAALQKWPGLNAEVRGDAIVYKKRYDLGIAVGGGKGLVVPVLRGADRLSFGEIEQGIAALADKAKQNTLTLDELQGGTFTISNGGVYGSMMSTPLLNMPQTGILGMHNIVKRPVAVGDAIEIRPMMYIALSYDHRVVDGREAVQFLIVIKQRIEAPDKLLLGL